MRYVARILLALLTLLPATAQGQGNDLENWLRWVRPDIRRDDASLRGWRRTRENLTAELLAVATDPRKASDARKGAIYVLGVAGDTQEVLRRLRGSSSDGALAEVAAAAAARVEARLLALAQLRKLAEHAGTPPGSLGAAALERAARSLPESTGPELRALTADSLFDAQTPERPLRCAAARLLGWAGGDAAPKLLAKTARDAFAGTATRRACLYALSARRQDRLLAAVLIQLGDQPQDWHLLRAGLELLDASSRGFRLACKKLLADGAASPKLQVTLAEDLAERRATVAVEYLRALAVTRRGFARHEHLALARALGRLDPSTVDTHAPQLVEYALASEDPLAADALETLRDLRPSRTGELLTDVLARPDPGGKIRVRALQVIELLSLQSLTSRVGKLLDEPIPSPARQAAAHALGSLGNAEGVLALARALQGNPGDGEAAALRREVADALGASSTQIDNGRLALERALVDPEPTVRRAALRALAAYGDARSQPSVRKLLERPATSARECQARLRACTRLSMFDVESARSLLALWRSQERDQDTALAVVAYGRNLPPTLVVDTLLDLLDHEHPAVGKATVAELLRRYTPGTESGTYGYKTATGATAKRAAIAKWRQTWRQERAGFR